MKGATPLTEESGTDETGDVYLLSHSTPAVQSVPSDDGSSRWGPIKKLSPGTRVRVCGAGFNRMTVSVDAGGSFYFIFREDLTSLDKVPNHFRESLKKLRAKLSRKEGRV